MRPTTMLPPLLLLLLTGLACGGGVGPAETAAEDPPGPTTDPAPDAEPEPEPEPEPEEGDDAWIEEAIEEAIEMEIMPGTSGEPEEGRREELRAFFEAHPEYADPAELEKLADLACGLGIEDGHEKLHNPDPLTPYTVTVDKPGWKLMVAHASYWCTSDDWSWFTHEVQTAVAAKGVAWDYAGAEHDVLIVKLGDKEVQRVPLKEQGYLMLRDGKEPEETGHDMPEGVIEEAMRVFR